MTKKSKAMKKYIRNLKSDKDVKFAAEFRFVDEGNQGNSYLIQFHTKTTSTEEAFVEMCGIATNCIKLDERFLHIPDRNQSFILRPGDINEMKRNMVQKGCHSYHVDDWFEVFMINLDRYYKKPEVQRLVADFKGVLGFSKQKIYVTNFWNQKYEVVDLKAVFTHPSFIHMTKQRVEINDELPIIVKKKDRDGRALHDIDRNPEINKRKDYEKRSEGELIYYESNNCWYLKEDGQFKYIGKTLKDEFAHFAA